MRAGTIHGLALVLSGLVMACAGSKGSVETQAAGSGSAASAASTASAPSAAPATAAGTGSSGPAAAVQAAGAASQASAAAPQARPFAKTALEAQSLIQEQIDAHMKPLLVCVNAYRGKNGVPHQAVVVDIGIDQEGTLLGVVTPNPKKGDLDPTLRDCLTATLHGLPFPRSHAGVITVRQTFTDVVVQQ